jgi:flavorubredoxin
MRCEAVRVTDNIYWVGAIDWGVRDFHGYLTSRGSSYNAYLVIDEKVTLFDTVKGHFFDEFLARISSVVDPSRIDYVVSNHAELDHSGCLPRVIATCRPEKVFASPAGVRNLCAHFDPGMELTAVRSGDEISLGRNTVSFLETKMLHWPDSMFSYLKEQKLLISQDAFGMHLASSRLFADENDMAVMEQEAAKYFANILLLYSPQILKLLDTVASMNLAIECIAPDHGPVWRKNIGWPIEAYRRWATQKRSAKAVVVYDTMWHNTERMAICIADGIRGSGADVKVIPMASAHRSDIATEVLEAGALLVGSPTLNNLPFPRTMDVLTYLKGLRPQGLIGGAFGSYGWSGEAVPILEEFLTSMKVEIVGDGPKVKYAPTAEDLERCVRFGKETGMRLLKANG